MERGKTFSPEHQNVEGAKRNSVSWGESEEERERAGPDLYCLPQVTKWLIMALQPGHYPCEIFADAIVHVYIVNIYAGYQIKLVASRFIYQTYEELYLLCILHNLHWVCGWQLWLQCFHMPCYTHYKACNVTFD